MHADKEFKAFKLAWLHRMFSSLDYDCECMHACNGYVERISRGVYKIIQKGEKLLEVLSPANWNVNED